MTYRNKSYDRNLSRVREEQIAEDDEDDLVKSKLENLSHFQLNFKHHTLIQASTSHQVIKKNRASTVIEKSITQTQPKEVMLSDDQSSNSDEIEIDSEMCASEVDIRANILSRYKNSFFNEKIKAFNEKKSLSPSKRMRFRGAEFAVIRIDKQPSIPTQPRDLDASNSIILSNPLGSFVNLQEKDRNGSSNQLPNMYLSQGSILSDHSKSVYSNSKISGKVRSDSYNNHLYSVEFRPSLNPMSSQFPSSSQHQVPSTPEYSGNLLNVPSSDMSLNIHPNTTKQVSLMQNRYLFQNVEAIGRVSKDAELNSHQPDYEDISQKVVRSLSQIPSDAQVATPSRRSYPNNLMPIYQGLGSQQLLQRPGNESNYTIDLPLNDAHSIRSPTMVRKLDSFTDYELIAKLVDIIYHKQIADLNQILIGKPPHPLSIVMQKEYRTDVLNMTDLNGNTPLMLAIKLAYMSAEYFEMVKLLLIHGSDPSIKDANNWAAIEETVAQMDIQSTSLIFDYLIRYKQIEFQRTRFILDQQLSNIEDFYLEIKWEFSSSIIPFFSKMAPSDVFKLHKRGTSLRLDQTFAGLKNYKAKRRDLCLIYNPQENGRQRKENQRDCQYITVLNRSKNHYFYPLQEIDPEEKRQIIFDLLNCDNVSGQLKFSNCSLQRSKNLFGKDVDTQISGWPAQKYDFKVKTEQQFQKKNHKPLLQTYEQYMATTNRQFTFVKASISPTRHDNQIINQFSQQMFSHTPRAKSDKIVETTKKDSKSKNCVVYIAREFPLRIQQFMPILSLLAQGNHLIQSLLQLLMEQEIQKLMVDEGFPIKVEIPISYSIEAIVTFQAYRKLEEESPLPDLFSIPSNLKHLHRKQAQKTMEREKKRLLLANLFLS